MLECRAKRAVLDGEIVCLDRKGNSQFKNLLFRRGEPRLFRLTVGATKQRIRSNWGALV
jgi:hypothetical protein